VAAQGEIFLKIWLFSFIFFTFFGQLSLVEKLENLTSKKWQHNSNLCETVPKIEMVEEMVAEGKIPRWQMPLKVVLG
jgi:hypothetical protein